MNLEAAPTKGMLQGDEIFVRPPLGLRGTQTFVLTAADTRKFDIENSFIDQKKGTSLHVVARIKKPKGPPGTRRGRRPPSNPPPSGANSSTTLSSWSRPPIASSSRPRAQARVAESWQPGERLQSREAGSDDESRRGLRLHRSNGIRDVAMIFEFPKAQKTYMSPKIGLCLECFAVGDLAGGSSMERRRRTWMGARGDGSPGAGPPTLETTQNHRDFRGCL